MLARSLSFFRARIATLNAVRAAKAIKHAKNINTVWLAILTAATTPITKGRRHVLQESDSASTFPLACLHIILNENEYNIISIKDI